MTSAGVPAEHTYEVLGAGELEIVGRLSDASNVTLLATATLDGHDVLCVYKPTRGERPLRDFPDATLALREVAAHVVAVAAGWNCVPPTVLRDGPLGSGMVQQWVGASPLPTAQAPNPDDSVPDPGPGESSDDEDQVVAIVPADRVPAGWHPVFSALDDEGTELAVCHADDDQLAVIAGFDAVVNNADRKASHLVTVGTTIWAIDHGLTFHEDDKLRTILWGWAAKPLPQQVSDGLDRLHRWLPTAQELGPLLSAAERQVLAQRVADLRANPVYPKPPADRTPIPWPPL